MKKSKIVYKLASYSAKVSMDTLDLPLYVYINVTDLCNFKCVFCSRDKNVTNFIKISDFEYVIDQLKVLSIRDIYITGGEPLLHPNIDYLIEYAVKKHFNVSVLTNGYYIDKHIDVLKKVSCVSVSLHGRKGTHNAITNVDCYNKVINNIMLIKNFTNVSINYTAFDININTDDIVSVWQLSIKNNIPMNISKYNDMGCGRNNNCKITLNNFANVMDSLLKQNINIQINNCIPPCIIDKRYSYLSHGCGAGNTFCCIDQFLNVKICSSSNKCIGNLRKTDFKKIWNCKILKNFRSLEWLPPLCTSCVNLTHCRGGCKVEASETLCSMNDLSVINYCNNIWNEIRKKQFYVCIKKIRKEHKYFVNLSQPPRLFNDFVKQVLNEINNTGSINAFENCKELILALYRDGLIKEKNDK